MRAQNGKETDLTNTKFLTRQKAEAHEALYPGLERLTRQLEAMAARNPSASVPPAARAIAADLLFDAQRFSAGVRRGLPEVADDLGGLVTQLGRALAQLDAFEAAHSAWNPDLKGFVWLLRDPLPVKRLRQETAAVIKSAKDKRQSDFYRSEVLRLMNAKVADSYDQGYADASSGHQHRNGGP
jgi:hypothetical protein